MLGLRHGSLFPPNVGCVIVVRPTFDLPISTPEVPLNAEGIHVVRLRNSIGYGELRDIRKGERPVIYGDPHGRRHASVHRQVADLHRLLRLDAQVHLVGVTAGSSCLNCVCSLQSGRKWGNNVYSDRPPLAHATL